MTAYTYLFINLGCLLFPLLFSFLKFRPFYKDWKYFIPANLIVALFFVLWDCYFTDIGVWGFNPDYLSGIYIANLPLEEVLFFICIPYACVFAYFALTYFVKEISSLKRSNLVCLVLASIILCIGLSHLHLWYTGMTFMLLGGYFLLSIAMRINQIWPLTAYALIIPFFLLSNGLLTGSYLEDPIVWYNDDENLGIRISTIPVEDLFYGMLMVLANINLYTFFKKRFS